MNIKGGGEGDEKEEIRPFLTRIWLSTRGALSGSIRVCRCAALSLFPFAPDKSPSFPPPLSLLFYPHFSSSLLWLFISACQTSPTLIFLFLFPPKLRTTSAAPNGENELLRRALCSFLGVRSFLLLNPETPAQNYDDTDAARKMQKGA